MLGLLADRRAERRVAGILLVAVLLEGLDEIAVASEVFLPDKLDLLLLEAEREFGERVMDDLRVAPVALDLRDPLACRLAGLRDDIPDLFVGCWLNLDRPPLISERMVFMSRRFLIIRRTVTKPMIIKTIKANTANAMSAHKLMGTGFVSVACSCSLS